MDRLDSNDAGTPPAPQPAPAAQGAAPGSRKDDAAAATGSQMLGEFLRRLRGSRSLQAIEDLSKQPPLAGRIRPVDVSTLSKIETGKQFPSLATLLSLEQLYEVPIQRFLDHVKLEKYWDLRPDASDHAQAMQEGRQLAQLGDYPKAYAAFLLAESLAADHDTRAAATQNKAGTLWKMGMLQEAINEYSDLLADPALPVETQVKALTNLAGVFHTRSNLFLARLHAQEGLRIADALGLVRSQAFLHRVLGTISDDLHNHAEPGQGQERHLRDALRHYEKSLTLFEDLGLPAEAAINRVNIGSVHCRLGNFIVGLKSLKEGLAECERHGNRRSVAVAHKDLGRAYFLARNFQKAKDHLFECERIADRQGYVDILFICYYYMREIEIASGGKGAHETKRLMRLRSVQEGRFWELEQFERCVRDIEAGIA